MTKFLSLLSFLFLIYKYLEPIFKGKYCWHCFTVLFGLTQVFFNR